MSEEHPDYAADDAQRPAAPTESDIKELVLEPFSQERFIAAQGMGLKWPIANEDYRTDGGLWYNGEILDAVIALWLCTLPITPKKADEWSVRRALRSPDRAIDAALHWGAEQGISQPESKAFWDAISRWEEIIGEIRSAHTIAAAHAGVADPKA